MEPLSSTIDAIADSSPSIFWRKKRWATFGQSPDYIPLFLKHNSQNIHTVSGTKIQIQSTLLLHISTLSSFLLRSFKRASSAPSPPRYFICHVRQSPSPRIRQSPSFDPPFSLAVPVSVRTCIPPFLPFPFLFRRRRRSRWDGISFSAGTCVQSPTSPHSRCKTAVATRENVVRCQLKTR